MTPKAKESTSLGQCFFFFFYCFSSFFFFFITFTLKTPSFALENLFVPYAFSFTGLRIVCGEMTYLCFSVREIRGALESFCYRSFTWIPNFLFLTCCLKRKLQNCLPNDLVREKKWEWRFAESVEVTEREREVLAKRVKRPGFPSNVANHAIKIILNNSMQYFMME